MYARTYVRVCAWMLYLVGARSASACHTFREEAASRRPSLQLFTSPGISVPEFREARTQRQLSFFGEKERTRNALGNAAGLSRHG